LKQHYDINSLVDNTGDFVEKDFDDQADMCELIRAAYAENKFPTYGNIVSKINKDFINEIRSVGF